jgi:hypothetical protein
MPSLGDERGGVVAKLLVLIVAVSVVAGGALYAYGTHQHPLAFEGSHAATDRDRDDPSSVTFASGATVSVATVVRNEGRLPVTIEGLSLEPPGRTEPMMPVSLGLGDGRTPTPSTTDFAPPALDPSSAIGVVITFGVNPNLSCARFGDEAQRITLPPVELRITSFGIESTQSVALDEDAPAIGGLTRARCEAVVG